MAIAPIPVKPFSRQFILEQLEDWRERLISAKDPIEGELARQEIDVWLDELSAWHRR